MAVARATEMTHSAGVRTSSWRRCIILIAGTCHCCQIVRFVTVPLKVVSRYRPGHTDYRSTDDTPDSSLAGLSHMYTTRSLSTEVIGAMGFD